MLLSFLVSGYAVQSYLAELLCHCKYKWTTAVSLSSVLEFFLKQVKKNLGKKELYHYEEPNENGIQVISQRRLHIILYHSNELLKIFIIFKIILVVNENILKQSMVLNI